MKDKIYIKSNPKIVFRLEEDEALLFDPDTGAIKVINRTGIFIWNLLDRRRSKEDIVRLLKEEFNDAPEEVVKEDIDSFIDSLKELKLVEALKSE